MKRFKIAGCVLTVLLFAAILGCAQSSTSYPIVLTDTPAMTITTAASYSTPTTTTGAREVHVQFLFGTVAGSYSACTVQAMTSLDGTKYYNIGAAETVTVSSATGNVWNYIDTVGSTTTASTTTATAFGKYTKFYLACDSYGTSAPVTITAIYYSASSPPQSLDYNSDAIFAALMTGRNLGDVRIR